MSHRYLQTQCESAGLSLPDGGASTRPPSASPHGDIADHLGERLRLLVVDDCHEHLQALSTVLSDLGYEVRVAHNGELALSQMDEFRPHGVLLDLNMPVMDGFELAQSLRTYLQHQTVLIGMSGAAPNDPATRGISLLVDEWFSKPIDLGALERCLADLLSLNRSCAA